MATKRSRVGPWMLIDSALGWHDRTEMAQLLNEAEQRVAEAEYAAEMARYDAAVARFERDRLGNRRAVRMATELANSRSRGIVSLPARMKRATAPRPAPTVPEPPTLEPPVAPVRRRPRSQVDAPRRLAVDRTATFPHLRVLHLGAAGRFARLAPHTAIDPARWRDQLTEGADLVLIEPPDGAPDWDPLAGELTALLRAAGDLGIPSIRIATPGSVGGPGNPTLDLLEGVGAGDTIAPSVDTDVFNPVGWRHEPVDPLVTILGRELDAAAGQLLRDFDPPVTLIHAPDLEVPQEAGIPRPVRTQAELRARLIRAGVLFDHPSWRADASVMRQYWTAALACGVPVVTVAPDRSADEFAEAGAGGANGADRDLPPGVIEVEDGDAVETVHRLLIDGDLRERHAIVGRRWALTTASRDTRLRELLDHLDVPVPAPPRTTVLMSTHRPEFVERGLDSVACQTQPNVDVSLVLHGDRFEHHLAPVRGDLVSSVVRAPGSWKLGDCLNAALDQASGELVAKMDDDDHYGPDHLRDLVNAWGYSGADIVGKRVEFVHLADRGVTLRRFTARPERDRPHVGGPTPLGARELFRQHRFLRVPNRVDSTLYDRVIAAGGRLYGIHSRDLVLERHGQDHAWSMEEDEFARAAIDERQGLALDFASSDPSVAG